MEGKAALKTMSYTGGRSMDKTEKTPFSLLNFAREEATFSNKSHDFERRSHCWTGWNLCCFPAYHMVSLQAVRTEAASSSTHR